MCKERPNVVTAFLADAGVEVLETMVDDAGKVRLIIFRDTRKGVYHWFQLEFLKPDGLWNEVFTVGERKLQTAIDLFTRARDFVKATPPPVANE